MKEILILSGKGGTGKTSITAAFAALAHTTTHPGKILLCDCDVDAADLHLLLNPENIQSADFQGGNVAVINQDSCSGCGQCQELCRYKAVIQEEDGGYYIDEIGCEGCGVCVDLCPETAIDFPVKTSGEWFIANTRFGSMVHARLGIAEENSGKLVTLIRKEARERAEKQALELLLTDGPPGIGCPVIAALGGVSLVVIVTEPTVSGLHDLERVGKLAAHFKVPALVCVNKADLNPEQSLAIKEKSLAGGMGFIGELPFDPAFTKAMIAEQTILEYAPDAAVSLAVQAVWEQIIKACEQL